MESTRIFLIGAGGHAKRCIDIFKDTQHIIGGIFDDVKTGEFYTCQILGKIQDIRHIVNKNTDFLFCCIGDNGVRSNVYIDFIDYNFINCISSTAKLSPSAKLGTGNFIGDFAILSSDSQIGSFNIINDNANFNHDCVMGDFNHISLTASLGGGVKLGNGNLIGIGASVNPRIHIGNWNIVGSGAVVIRNISNFGKYVGVPAKEI